MKKLIILFLSFILIESIYAQDNYYFLGGVGDDYMHDVLGDEAGNLYMTGSYLENLDSKDDRINSVGGRDIYVMKFDKDMNRVWVNSMGGKGVDEGKSIAISPQGNLYLMSTYTDSIRINDKMYATSSKDVLFTSLDRNGKLLWSKPLKGKGNYEGVDLAIDNKGNMYSIVTFSGVTEIGGKKYTSSSDKDALLIRMDPKGNITWINQLTGLYDNIGISVETDEMGNVYFAGNFKGKVQIAGGEYVVDGNSDIFLMKYGPDGKLKWVKRSKGEDVNRVSGMAVDDVGNVYLTGSFERYISFDAKRVSSASDKDMFLVKYNPEGDVEWLRYAAGGFAHDRGRNVGIDKNGNIYVTGTYTGSVTFIDLNLEGVDMRQLYIAKYSPEGEVLTVQRSGGVGVENSLFVVPTYYGVVTVGEFDDENTLTEVPMKSQGGRDIFIKRNE